MLITNVIFSSVFLIACNVAFANNDTRFYAKCVQYFKQFYSFRRFFFFFFLSAEQNTTHAHTNGNNFIYTIEKKDQRKNTFLTLIFQTDFPFHVEMFRSLYFRFLLHIFKFDSIYYYADLIKYILIRTNFPVIVMIFNAKLICTSSNTGAQGDASGAEGILVRKHDWESTTKKAANRSWDKVSSNQEK